MTADLKLITESTAAFALAMSELASGVVLVTCWLDDRAWGMTVTAFASVSADPPTVLVSLRPEGRSARAIEATRRFGVSILAAEHVAVARYGSVPGANKFIEPYTELGRSTTPAVEGALAHLDCELSDAVEVADHVVLFGRVQDVAASRAGTPLLYHRRAYRALNGRNL
jgi:flavin reductase (DIM6/NTAB) family NADH-FMN oxidoreductase RutF